MSNAINIFNDISDERKVELRELILEIVSRYKESEEYKISKSKSYCDFELLRAKLVNKCLRFAESNFTKAEKLYMTLYIITDNDENYLRVCKSCSKKESGKSRVYDFQKISEVYNIKKNIAHLRYQIALENKRIELKNETIDDFIKALG